MLRGPVSDRMVRPSEDRAVSGLLNDADSLCSLILYRESRGLSEQTKRELTALVGRLRVASTANARSERA